MPGVPGSELATPEDTPVLRPPLWTPVPLSLGCFLWQHLQRRGLLREKTGRPVRQGQGWGLQAASRAAAPPGPMGTRSGQAAPPDGFTREKLSHPLLPGCRVTLSSGWLTCFLDVGGGGQCVVGDTWSAQTITGPSVTAGLPWNTGRLPGGAPPRLVLVLPSDARLTPAGRQCYDLLVIGGGSGGLACAKEGACPASRMRLARRGLRGLGLHPACVLSATGLAPLPRQPVTRFVSL